MSHCVVPVGDFLVPLIGVPRDAGLEPRVTLDEAQGEAKRVNVRKPRSV